MIEPSETPGEADNASADEQQSPYEPPAPSERPPDISTNPSVYEEPWMRTDSQTFVPLPEPVAGFRMFPPDADPEHSVWDEPGRSVELSGDVPDDAVTWLKWCRENARQTTVAYSWTITLGVALVSGVWAVLGALLLQQAGNNHWYSPFLPHHSQKKS